MEKKKEERQQIDAVLALRDAMHVVCYYLNERDLRSVALVCKAWKEPALNELGKRPCIQNLDLPAVRINLGNTLSWLGITTPKVTLVFCDVDTKELLQMSEHSANFVPDPNICGICACYARENEAIRDFKEHLPNKIILFHTHKFFTSNGAEDQVVGVLGSSSVLGLFFSNLPKRFRVNFASIRTNDIKNPTKTLRLRITKELGLNKCKYEKSTILMLGNFLHLEADNRIIKSICKMCKRAKNNKKKVTLVPFYGSRVRSADTTYECKKDDCNPWNDQELLILLRIAGPTIDSWSTFIYYRSSQDVLERQLRNLKERVKRKRFCLGFFASPMSMSVLLDDWNDYANNDSQAMVRTLNRIFPDIQFTGSFVYIHDHPDLEQPVLPSVQTFDDYNETDPIKNKINLRYFTSVTIISYD